MNSPKPDPAKLVALKSKSPPCCPEIESAIVGCVLFDPGAIARIESSVKPEYFYYSQFGEIYRACLALHHAGKPTDIMTVALWLNDRGLLDKVGGKTALLQAVDEIVSAANVDQYADLLVKKWRRREMIRVCREIASLAHDESVNDESLQNDVESVLMSLFSASQDRSLRHISEFVDGELERIQEIQAGKAERSLSTGFVDLDKKIIGLQPGDLTIVAGRPGSGKTAVSGAIAANVAAQGKPVAVFSLEMGGGQIAQRMLAAFSSIDTYQLRIGQISDRMWTELSQASNKLKEMPVWIDPSQSISVNHIRSEARRLIAERGKIGAIVIDYLHLMLDGSDEDVREIGKITRQLKLLAKELDTSIVLLSQLNRAVENRNDKRPLMSDLRSSGAIEQDADVILMLYRDDYYNENSPDKGVAEINVVKNRNGSTGTVKLLFEPQFSRFRNINGEKLPSENSPSEPNSSHHQNPKENDSSEHSVMSVEDAIGELRITIAMNDPGLKKYAIETLGKLSPADKKKVWKGLTQQERDDFNAIADPD